MKCMLKLPKNESGIIRILPVLLIVAAGGIIAFLLLSSTAPFRGFFNILFPKPPTRADMPLSFPMPSDKTGLNVVGNQIRNSQNQAIYLVGVNRYGTGSSCTLNPPSVFYGPSDLASVQAIARWHA